ncbi:Hypothetical predicted protein [Cloeon dipterum]|uniref:Metalloendopeptidase n=1 Tax=Cloeon dipterum TaxID=197152 RepID=A0A8S1DPY0_9INSE|nr:Hypothetical predicted protein [Cloeon dipterum]
MFRLLAILACVAACMAASQETAVLTQKMVAETLTDLDRMKEFKPSNPERLRRLMHRAETPQVRKNLIEEMKMLSREAGTISGHSGIITNFINDAFTNGGNIFKTIMKVIVRRRGCLALNFLIVMFRFTIVVLACVAVSLGKLQDESKKHDWLDSQLLLLQGDIVLSPDNEWMGRSDLIEPIYSWPNGRIPYVISDSQYSEYQTKIIKQAMEVFNTQTKVRFVPKEEHDEDYVLVADRGRCWSPLGRKGGAQVLSLKTPWCLTKEIVLREMMHTVGFVPEHSRPDRDDYITILWDNIPPNYNPLFEKFTKWFVDTNVPYDYNSITHYSPKAFSANGQNTIIAKDPSIKLGPGATLSELDIGKVNLTYKDANHNDDDDNGTSPEDACNKRIQKIIDFSKAILRRKLGGN